MTTKPAPRPFWIVALGGFAGFVVGVAWTVLAFAALDAVDAAGFRWPLPWPLAVVATIAVACAVWLPFAPLFLRVGFRWWHVLIVGPVPLAGIAVASVTGVRLAAGIRRTRSATT